MNETSDQSIVCRSDAVSDNNVDVDLADLEVCLLSIREIVHATLLLNLSHHLAQLKQELLNSLQISAGLALSSGRDGILEGELSNFALTDRNEGIRALEKQVLVHDLQANSFFDGLEGAVDSVAGLEHDKRHVAPHVSIGDVEHVGLLEQLFGGIIIAQIQTGDAEIQI